MSLLTSFKFKPEDFIEYETTPVTGSSRRTIDWMADKANALLQAHLATLPRVYGMINESYANAFDSIKNSQFNTHTALLWGITEIEKKECEHAPIFINKTDSKMLLQNMSCGKCGVKLKAKWEKA